MLVSQFEKIGMLEDETFNEFYDKINDIRNSIINLGRRFQMQNPLRRFLDPK